MRSKRWQGGMRRSQEWSSSVRNGNPYTRPLRPLVATVDRLLRRTMILLVRGSGGLERGYWCRLLGIMTRRRRRVVIIIDEEGRSTAAPGRSSGTEAALSGGVRLLVCVLLHEDKIEPWWCYGEGDGGHSAEAAGRFQSTTCKR